MLESRFSNSPLVKSRALKDAKDVAIGKLASSLATLSQDTQVTIDSMLVSDTSIYDNDDASVMGFNPLFKNWNKEFTMPTGWMSPEGKFIAVVNVAKGGFGIKDKLYFAPSNKISSIKKSVYLATPFDAGTSAMISWHVSVHIPNSVTPVENFGVPRMRVRMEHAVDGTDYTETESVASLSSSVLDKAQYIKFVARGRKNSPIVGITIIFERGTGALTQNLDVVIESFAMALVDNTFDNKEITITDDGTLMGAGVGKVTISGLAPKLDINANKSINHIGFVGRFGDVLSTAAPTNLDDCFLLVNVNNTDLLAKEIYTYVGAAWVKKGNYNIENTVFFNTLDNMLYKGVVARNTVEGIPVGPFLFSMQKETDLSKILTNGEKFTDALHGNKEWYWNATESKFVLTATVGAPAGTTIMGIPVEDLIETKYNYDNRNDEDFSAVSAVTNLTNTFKTSSNGNGNAEVAVTWKYNGDSCSIDGFLVEARAAETNAAQNFSTTHGSGDVVKFSWGSTALEKKTDYSYVYTNTANKFFSFAVWAYRSVNKSSSKNSTQAQILFSSPLVINPFQPSGTITFNGVDVTQLSADAADTAKIVNDILKDSIITGLEKGLQFQKWIDNLSDNSASEYKLAYNLATTPTTIASATSANVELKAARDAVVTLLTSTYFPIDGTIYESPLFDTGLTKREIANHSAVFASTDHKKLTHTISNKAIFEATFATYSEKLAARRSLSIIDHSAIADMVSSVTEMKNITEDSLITAAEKSLTFQKWIDNLSTSVATSEYMAARSLATTALTTASATTANLALKTARDAVVALLTETYFVIKDTIYESPLFDAGLTKRESASHSNVVPSTDHKKLTHVISDKKAIEIAFAVYNEKLAARRNLSAVDHPALVGAIDIATHSTAVLDTVATIAAKYSSTAGVPAATGIPVITYDNDANDDGRTNATISWEWGGLPAEYTNFVTCVVTNKIDNFSATLTHTIVYGAGVRRVSTNKSVEFSNLGTTSFNKAYTFVYKEVSKAVYDAAPAASRMPDKLWLVSPVSASAVYKYNTGTLVIKADLKGSDGVIVKATEIKPMITDFNSVNDSTLTDVTLVPTAGYPVPYHITFSGNVSGSLDVTCNWVLSTYNESKIDGFLVYLVALESLTVVPALPAITTFSGIKLVSNTARSVEFPNMGANHTYNFIVIPYRIINDVTYLKPTVTNKAKFYATPVVYNTSYAWAATYNRIYSAMYTKSATAPVEPVKGDYWISTVSYLTTRFDGAIWKALTVPEWADFKAKKFNTTFESLTELPNVSGFYWKNTSDKTVSGVPSKAIVTWNDEDSLWEGKNKTIALKKLGNKITTATIEIAPYEGSIYIGEKTVDGKAYCYLFAAQNGSWKLRSQLLTANTGLVTPAKTLTILKYLDKSAFVYYTRKTILDNWVAFDLFVKKSFGGAAAPKISK